MCDVSWDDNSLLFIKNECQIVNQCQRLIENNGEYNSFLLSWKSEVQKNIVQLLLYFRSPHFSYWGGGATPPFSTPLVPGALFALINKVFQFCSIANYLSKVSTYWIAWHLKHIQTWVLQPNSSYFEELSEAQERFTCNTWNWPEATRTFFVFLGRGLGCTSPSIASVMKIATVEHYNQNQIERFTNQNKNFELWTYNAILYNTILYNTILYNTILYKTILYNIVLYNTVLYNTILYNTILYNTVL